MNSSTPVEAIARALEGAGFKRLATPLNVAGITFEVPAILIRARPFQDLILVVDTALEKEEKLLRNIQAMARALDLAQSVRPMTVVVAGPRPAPDIMLAMSKVCRVLPVSPSKFESLDGAISNWLAVFMPLPQPSHTQVVANPLGTVLAQVAGLDPGFAVVIDKARRGAPAVQGQLAALLKEALREEEQ